MQLKLQRSQRVGGVLGNTVIFCVDARAAYNAIETANIVKYKLGNEVIYSSQAARKHLERAGTHMDRTKGGATGEMAIGLARGIASFAMAKMNLNISIASLGRGHHIECKDLTELLDAEQTLMEACRNIRQFLQVAATFNGSIILVDFDDDEKTQMSQGTIELAALPAPGISAPVADDAAYDLPLAESSQETSGMVVPTAPILVQNPPIAIIVSVIAAILILGVFGVHFLSLVGAAALIGGGFMWERRAQ